jgi:hypothetical protein
LGSASGDNERNVGNMTTSMQPSGLEQRYAKAVEALDAASSVTPKRWLYGLYTYDDGPGWAGGGQGMFGWFETWDELLAFVAEHLAYACGHDHGDSVQAEANARATLDELQAGRIDASAARMAVNVALQWFMQVEWWGKAEELLSDPGEFAQRLRAEWREANDEQHGEEEDLGRPIDEESAEEFLDSLEGYGV